MGPVGSSRVPDAPSGGGQPRAAARRRLALVVVVVLFVVMCGMIAWSQWYAIHVNVPLYRAHHAASQPH